MGVMPLLPHETDLPDYDGSTWIGQGSISYVDSSQQEKDAVELLRRVVEEVTGKPIPRPIKKPMGFY